MWRKSRKGGKGLQLFYNACSNLPLCYSKCSTRRQIGRIKAKGENWVGHILLLEPYYTALDKSGEKEPGPNCTDFTAWLGWGLMATKCDSKSDFTIATSSRSSRCRSCFQKSFFTSISSLHWPFWNGFLHTMLLIAKKLYQKALYCSFVFVVLADAVIVPAAYYQSTPKFWGFKQL